MIKFFRKIRLNLLSERKTGKYLKYAIGEIFLVVIGILIALQINNWNEYRKDVALEIDYLSGIKSDLESDIKRTKRMIGQKTRKISAFHKLDSTFIPGRHIKLRDISLDSIDIKFVFKHGEFHRLKVGSYTALTSNASIGLIKNKALIQLIQYLYEVRQPSIFSVYEDIKRKEEYLGWKYAHEKRNLDLRSFFINNTRKEEVLDDFAFYYDQHKLMCNSLIIDLDIMNEIIKAIEVEIEQR